MSYKNLDEGSSHAFPHTRRMMPPLRPPPHPPSAAAAVAPIAHADEAADEGQAQVVEESPAAEREQRPRARPRWR